VGTRVAAVLVALAAPVLLAGAAAPATASGPAVQRIVTLGDSYSSGTGIHRNASDYDDHGPPAQAFSPATRIGNSTCLRELDETPGPRLAARLGVPSVFVACAGATIADIGNQLDVAAIPGRGRGTVVTLTVGGNDLRSVRGETWPQVLLRCITSAGCHGSERNQTANLVAIRADLTTLYTAIGDRHPDITVRVLAYPRMMQAASRCDGVTGFSRSEADWVDAQIDQLNGAISAAVRDAAASTGADIVFVPVVAEFDNRGACRFWQRDRYVNDAVFGETLARSMADGVVRDHWNRGPLQISAASFHPSSAGYGAYLRALAGSLDGVVATDLRRP
jgi:lysophospholipase L1-like esterase